MKLIIIGGATASGKTSLAIDLAKRINGEIISCDSIQIYKGMDIGTSKVTEKEMCGVTHHMLDVISPNEEYSVVDYQNATIPIIDNLLKNNIQPILVGGTGYYINSIINKMSYGFNDKSNEIREELERYVNEYGREALHERLKDVDKESYEKLHQNDVKRVIRALEIYYKTGKTKSSQNDDEKRYEYNAFMIDIPREHLYNNINDRVEEMFNLGLVKEVECLYSTNLSKTAKSGIGYKEVIDYLEGNITIEQCKELIKLNTRHYAKRQITWFKNQLKPKLIDYKLNNKEKVDYLINNLD